MDLANIAEMQENVWMKRQRRKRQRLLITEIFFDYARNSTLHGLRYITEKRLRTFEKLFWFVTFAVSLAFCCYHIANVYVKWRDSPVIVTVSERLVSADTVPFPSVTICPQLKCKATVYNFTNMTKYINRSSQISDPTKTPHLPMTKEMQKYELISALCIPKSSNFTHSEHHNISIIDVMNEVSPTIEDAFMFCFWQGGMYKCKSVFSKVYTHDGLCFNFNGISGRELFRHRPYNIISNRVTQGWNTEAGYYNDSISKYKMYPRRGQINGGEPDLEIYLRTKIEDEDMLCNVINTGYKIFLHHPTDMVQSSLYYYSAGHGQVTSLAVNVNILNTSDSLKKYKPTVRQCYFPGDRYLQHFQIYSLKNCQAECLANYTIRGCGCAAYYMPRNVSTKVCELHDGKCIDAARKRMTNAELNWETKKYENLCRCLPACNSVDYEAEVLKTAYNIDVYTKNKFAQRYNSTPQMIHRYSKVELYYKRSQFICMRRSEIFGFTDFMANIGGLLGVFLGFSFISLVEIIYFLTIRIGFSLKKDLKEEKIQLDSITTAR